MKERLNDILEIYDSAYGDYMKKPTKENRKILLKCYEDIPLHERHYIDLCQEMSEIIDVFEERLTLEDVAYIYNWFEQNKFHLKEWKCRDAFKDDEGCLIEFIKGEKYEDRWAEFIKNGWKEDRCEFRGCTITIGDKGYTFDNRNWICEECFDILQEKNKNNMR